MLLRKSLGPLLIALVPALQVFGADAVPPPLPRLTYQGRLAEEEVPVNGTRVFRFAIVSGSGSVYWSGEPVSVQVRDGLYATVVSGFPADLLVNPGLKLRVSISGTTLDPDLPLVPGLQTLTAFSVVPGAIGTTAMVDAAVTTAKIADKAITAEKLADGVVLSGPAGPAGPIGPAGAPGPAGQAGIDGRTILSGAGLPAAALGRDGDWYVDTAAVTWCGPKANGAWPSAIPLVGATGQRGPAGADGMAVRSGHGVPTPGIGVDGDFYVDVDATVWYGPKAAGAWPAGLPLGNAGTLAAVATSGSYADLSNRPTLGTAAPLNKAASGDAAVTEVVIGSDTRLSDQRVPTDGSVSTAKLANSAVTDAKVSDVAWSKVTARPTTVAGYGITDAASSAQGAKADTAVQPGALATVATSGSYTDLSNRPTLGTAAPLNKAASGDAAAAEVVIGSDTRLSDQRVPTDGSVSTAKLANNAVTDAKVSDVAWSKVTSRPTTVAGYGITDAASSAQGAKADTAVQPGSLATVATSGSYTDLSNRPTLGTAAPLNKAVSGDAAATEVVIGSDTRLSDQRVPTDGSVTTSKLANSAVTDAKVSDVAWSKVTARPTTVAGYGITDAASSAQGAKADSAVQPASLATIATSGVAKDLGNPTTALAGAAVTPDASQGLLFTWTLSANGTLNAPSNLAAGQVMVLRISQDATGGRSVTWNSAYKWSGGTAPAVTAVANAVDVLTVINVGGALHCVLTQDIR